MSKPEQNERTRQLLTEHARTYPELTVQDVLKFLHQSVFGCEHLVTSVESAAVNIEREYAGMSTKPAVGLLTELLAGTLTEPLAGTPAAGLLTEPLAGDYGRVSLSCLSAGLRADTLARLFVASSKREAEGAKRLRPMLEIAGALAREGALPFSHGEFEDSVAQWAAKGYPAVRHSERFREKYHPAYRVIAKEYILFLPLLAEIDRRLASGTRAVIAIEGGSASGKTTLSRLLEELYACTVFHMDDFFLQAWQRTPERYAQPGGNIDHERFLAEVLQPLQKGEPVRYRKFDCSSLSLGAEEEVTPGRLVIVEGA